MLNSSQDCEGCLGLFRILKISKDYSDFSGLLRIPQGSLESQDSCDSRIPQDSLGFLWILGIPDLSLDFLGFLGWLEFCRILQEPSASLGFLRVPKIPQDSLGLLHACPCAQIEWKFGSRQHSYAASTYIALYGHPMIAISSNIVDNLNVRKPIENTDHLLRRPFEERKERKEERGESRQERRERGEERSEG